MEGGHTFLYVNCRCCKNIPATPRSVSASSAWVGDTRVLFPRLQQCSRPSRAGEQPRKGEGGSREKKRIDRKPRENQIGAQNMVDQHPAQALENISRRQNPTD